MHPPRAFSAAGAHVYSCFWNAQLTPPADNASSTLSQKKVIMGPSQLDIPHGNRPGIADVITADFEDHGSLFDSGHMAIFWAKLIE